LLTGIISPLRLLSLVTIIITVTRGMSGLNQAIRVDIRSKTLGQLIELLKFLPKQRLRDLSILLSVSAIASIFDLVFIGLMARLVSVLSGASLPNKIPQIAFFGGNLTNQSLWIAALLIISVWCSSALSLFVNSSQAFLSAQIWSDYGDRIFSNIVFQRLEYFQDQKSANLLGRINLILGQISDRIISPLLLILSSILSSLVLLIGVTFVLGRSVLFLFAFLFLSYALISIAIIPPLRLASKQKLRFVVNVNSILLESFQAIRDIQLYGAEKFYIRKFSLAGHRGKKYDRISRLLPEIPRYIVEPAGVTFILAFLFLPALTIGNAQAIREAIPEIAALLLATFKLSKPVQTIFRSINKFRGGLPEISDAILLLSLKPERLLVRQPFAPSPAGIFPKHTIQLDNVSYRYPQAINWSVKDLNIIVPVGARVALVGSTGSGKSTIVNLLIGLFQPHQGCVLLDGIPVQDAELHSWQACCAFVPQHITLLDASVRENIAFGVDPNLIDDDEIWEALEAAQLHDFIAALPYGIYTLIGENGVRLSGGQRQRLALARAFFKRAQLLVLDEATSALDSKTENQLMSSLEVIGRRCTTVVVAHRLSTIRNCDRIYEIANGSIKASGNFTELVNQSSSFKEFVTLGNG